MSTNVSIKTIIYSVLLMLEITTCASFTGTKIINSRHRFNAKTTPHVHLTNRGKPSCQKMSTDGSSNDGFFTAFLSEENNELSKYTHMIGIPLEENRDLLLELESVQRAVLYNCPLLIHSCIVPVMTRMPLLYVDTVMATGGLSANREDVTETLQQIVEEVVEKHIRTKSSNKESIGASGINKEGIKPIVMTFKGLELDGDQCEVLHVVGNKDCDGTNKIRLVLEEIREKVEAKGWRTILPPDNPQGQQISEDEWRPRVPFMRLPNDFKETLPPLPDGEDEDSRLPEDGGNGISPIFWYKWWEDDFTNEDGTRLTDIAIYSRSGPWGLSEKAFYMASSKVKLPDGNDIRQKSEAKDREYAETRLKEQLGEEGAALEIELSQQIADATQQYADEVQQSSFETDIFDSSFDESTKSESQPKWNEDSIQNGASTYFSGTPDSSQIRKPGDPIVRNLSSPTTKLQSEKNSVLESSPKKDLENIDFDRDEGILRIRKMLRQKPTRAADSKPKEATQVLPPYPSDEHFVGVWRLVSSPNKNFDRNNILNLLPDASDNIILRVDGGVAGGPTLNEIDKQKAAGGNWRMFQARWAGGGDMPEMESTRLRIRLLIPPEKKEVLVMEGEVTRVMMPGGASTLSLNTNFLNSEDDTSADDQVLKKKNDFFLHCDGEVWVQDIEGTGRRRKLGMFSAIKLDTPREGSIRYTIPSMKAFKSNDSESEEFDSQ